MFKRGVSPVVATVLLLVLTIGLAAIIFAFVIPFVQDQLGNSKACLKVQLPLQTDLKQDSHLKLKNLM